MAPEEHHITNDEAKEIADALAKVMEGKPVKFRDDNGWSRNVKGQNDPGGIRIKDYLGMTVTIVTVIGGMASGVYYLGSKVKGIEGQLNVIPQIQADIRDIKNEQAGFMRQMIELKVRFDNHETTQKIREARIDKTP